MIYLLFFPSVVRTLAGHKSGIRSLDFHPYGDYVASGSLDCNIKVDARARILYCLPPAHLLHKTFDRKIISVVYLYVPVYLYYL